MWNAPRCAVAVRNMMTMPAKNIFDGPELVLFFLRMIKTVSKNRLAYIPAHKVLAFRAVIGVCASYRIAMSAVQNVSNSNYCDAG